MGVDWGSRTFWGRWGPPFGIGCMAGLLKYVSPHMCYHTKFGRSRANLGRSARKRTPRVPPVSVTQGPRCRHGSIGHSKLPVSDPGILTCSQAMVSFTHVSDFRPSHSLSPTRLSFVKIRHMLALKKHSTYCSNITGTEFKLPKLQYLNRKSASPKTTKIANFEPEIEFLSFNA